MSGAHALLFLVWLCAFQAATFSARAQEDVKPTEARDLGRDVTGVFVASPVGAGGYAPDFMFRGLDNGGLVLRDGFTRGFYSSPVELSGVERSQFVKGVTSMVYGTVTSAAGAAVNYITKKPVPETFLNGDFSVGSFAYRRITFDLNTPLSDTKNLLFRLNVAAQEKGSFIDFVHERSVYVNPALTLVLDNGDRLSLRGEYSASHYAPPLSGLPTYAPSPVLLQLPRYFYAGDPVNEHLWSLRQGLTLRYEHEFNADWRAAAIVDYSRGNTAFGWSTNWTFDGSRSISYGFPVRTTNRVTNFAAQASLSGHVETDGLSHRLFFGYERWSYNSPHDDKIGKDSLPELDILAPVYPGPADFTSARMADGADSAWTNSVFAQDLIELGKQWRLLVGGRYDYLATHQTVNDPSGALTGSPIMSSSSGFNTKISPRAGIIYRPYDSASIHAAYGQSFIPNIGVRLAGGKLAPPEADTLYELGVRQNLLDKKIDLDLGVFDVTRNHVPSLDPVNPSGFYSLVTGQQHSHGVEASLGAQVTRNLRLTLAATFLHALVTKDTNTPTQAGSDLLGAPRRVYNSSASYSFDTGPLKGLDLGASFYFASVAQATLPNTRGFTLPPIRNLSLSASYKLADHVTVALNASNLTDSANFTSNGLLMRGEPRTIGASLSYKY